MRKLSMLTVGAIALLATALITGYASATNHNQAEITALQERLIDAIRNKDYDAIMSCYIPSEKIVIFDVVPPRQYVGVTAYKEDWKAALSVFKGPFSVRMSDLTIASNGGDLAFGHSIQDFSGVDAKGTPVQFVLRATDCYRKVDGKWLIEHEHYSVPVDLATGKSDLLSKP